QYRQVYVLILTWSFHDLKEASYTAPTGGKYTSLEDETKRLRGTFERRGYSVYEFDIPMQRSTESLRQQLKNFCLLARDDTLLIVYYHGHGSLDDDNELMFSSHEHPANVALSKTAAAELYEAMITGEACHAHGRSTQYRELVKKYERYRPVSTVEWEAIRPIVLSASSDMLLILDCCAAGGATATASGRRAGGGSSIASSTFSPSSLHFTNWKPPTPAQRKYTKHLFAACGFESSTTDDMTAAMCHVLDTWTPPPSPPRTQLPYWLTTKRLHQIMEDRLRRNSVGSQPIFRQLLPVDPEKYITLPDLSAGAGAGPDAGMSRGRRGGGSWRRG
ncbi:hypothetical protein B0T17DRAFT_501389, partial [Bombardia bombarda]